MSGGALVLRRAAVGETFAGVGASVMARGRSASDALPGQGGAVHDPAVLGFTDGVAAHAHLVAGFWPPGAGFDAAIVPGWPCRHAPRGYGPADGDGVRLVMELIAWLVRSDGVTAVVATHDRALIELADAVHHLSDGELVDVTGTDAATLGQTLSSRRADAREDAGSTPERLHGVTPTDARPASATRDLAYVATFAAIVAALGLVPSLYPFGAVVPITAQSLGVMLAGAVLGARRGGLAVLLFVVLVALGLPLLSGGRGGLGQFAGPSVGFLVGFPVAAWATGWFTERGGSSYSLAWGIVANLFGGIVVLYLLGIPGVAARSALSLQDAASASAIYLPGDVIKAVLAALVARGVHQAYPGLLGRTRAREPADA